MAGILCVWFYMGEVDLTIGFLVQITLDPYASHHNLFLVRRKHIESCKQLQRRSY